MSSLTLLGAGGTASAPPAGNTFNPLRGTPGQTSPIIHLTGGNLTAQGDASANGCTMSVSGIASGSKSYSFLVSGLGAGDSMWWGCASASHVTTDGGNSWAGGDIFVSGAYNSNGTAYQVGGSAGNLSNLIFVNGDTLHATIDATARTLTLWVNSGSTSVLIAPATGTLYAALGLEAAASIATADFSAFP